METKDILRSIEETKDLIRRVRTPGGARRYGQPIGSIIVRDKPTARAPRRGTRRAQSLEADRQSPETPRARQQGAQERPVVAEAQVAPSPEVAEGSTESASVTTENGSGYTVGQKYVKNDPLIAAELDYEFLRTGTARQAYGRLKALGANVEMGEAFVKNREFMTTLAEVTRILEQEFPGFVARHGNYFSTGVKGNTGGFNTFMRKRSTTESNAGVTGEDIEAGSTGSQMFGGMQGSIEGTNNNATATVFTPTGIKWTERDLRANMKRTGTDEISHMSMTDAYEDFLEKGLTTNQVGAMHVITHELGHAISRAVGGRMSFEIDGKTDPDQGQRRWYREYYANSRLKFLDEMGVIKWSGKEYVADSLIDQKAVEEFYRKVTPTIQPPKGTKPRRAAYNASPEARERARKRVDEWNAQVVAYNTAWARARREMTEAMESGKIPTFKPTREDIANGYGMETESLHSFIRSLHRNGFIEEPVSPSKLRPLNNMTSKYGATNWMEIEAETWAAYMLNGNVTEGVSKWGEQMHTMYQWWTDDDARLGGLDPEAPVTPAEVPDAPEEAPAVETPMQRLHSLPPDDFDRELAAIYGEQAANRKKLESATDSIHRMAGDKKTGPRGYAEWGMSDDEAEKKAQEKYDAAEYKDSYALRSLENYRESRKKVAATQEQIDERDAVFRDRGGWSRFFLVNNTGGHIHSSVNCSTTRPTTQFGWLPDVSGKSEEEAVAEHGAMLCTVCFPSAPTEWTNHWDKEEERKKAESCPGSGTAQWVKGSTRFGYASGNGGTCAVCGQYASATSSGLIRKHKKASA